MPLGNPLIPVTDISATTSTNHSPGGSTAHRTHEGSLNMAVKTWAQLRAAFADTSTGNITAADMRDLVDTLESRETIRVENANGISLRFPASMTQVCFGVTAQHELTHSDGSGVRTATHTHTFPQPFADTPEMVGGVKNIGGNVGGCYANATSPTAFAYRLYAQASGIGAVSFVAWGEYTP